MAEGSGKPRTFSESYTSTTDLEREKPAFASFASFAFLRLFKTIVVIQLFYAVLILATSIGGSPLPLPAPSSRVGVDGQGVWRRRM